MGVTSCVTWPCVEPIVSIFLSCSLILLPSRPISTCLAPSTSSPSFLHSLLMVVSLSIHSWPT